MADAFENRLAALFDAELAASDDVGAFLAEVEARIARRHRARRVLVYFLAGAGAAAATLLLTMVGALRGLTDLVATAGDRVGHVLPPLGSPALQSQVGWCLLGLLAFAAATGVRQFLDES